METSDEEIVRMCCSAPAGAYAAKAGFRLLYDRFAPRVRAVLFRYCEPADMSDLVQETFIKVWTALPTFKQEGSLGAWVCRIAVNVAKDHSRARRRKWWLTLFTGNAEEEPVVPAPAPDDDGRHDVAMVRQAVAALPEKLRTVVVLHSLDELDLEEVAEILEIPVGTVKSRLHQARGRLRHRMGRAKIAR